MFYKFEYKNPTTVVNDIQNYTSNSTDADLKKYVSDVSDKLSQVDPTSTICQGFLYAPSVPEITKAVIGKGGCYFHMTTNRQNIYFIWHDRNTNKFLFWGEKYNLIRAMNIINHRIQNAIIAHETQVNEDAEFHSKVQQYDEQADAEMEAEAALHT